MSDADLLEQFEKTTLPFTVWNHRCHVRIAHLYLSRHGFEEGLERIRCGIKAYNKAHQVPEGPLSGYNETTTRAFAHLIAAVTQAYGDVLPAGTSDEFCDQHPELMTRHILRLFYTPERRMQPEAKTLFVEPDLAPLPRLI